jgi:ATP-binding cassette subfamily B protein
MFMPLIFAPLPPLLVVIPVVYILAYFLSLWHYLRTAPDYRRARQAFGRQHRLAEAIDGETVKGMAQEKRNPALQTQRRRYRDAFVQQGYVEARFLPLLWLAIAQAAGLLQALILFQRGLLNVAEW